jgi:hypothetical protein
MTALVTITRSELDAEPAARLSALVTFLAEHREYQSRETVKSFWLAYTYDAEVLNGGHLQYFHNHGTGDVPATLKALRLIGGRDHAALLEDCWSKVKREPISRVDSLEQYPALAAERSFTVEDNAYYKLRPEVLRLLELHYAPLLAELVAVGA